MNSSVKFNIIRAVILGAAIDIIVLLSSILIFGLL